MEDTESLRVLVVAGSPEPSSTELVGRLCRQADFVVAADRGADALRAADVVPDVFCGDADSVSEDTKAWALPVAGRDALYPRKKDDTDLGLALSIACEEARRRGLAACITVTCASGGRADHALGVFGVLARTARELRVQVGGDQAAVRLVEDGFECRLLAGGQSWELGPSAQGRTFSALSLAQSTLVTERDMEWSVTRSRLGLLDDRGVSNVVTGPAASVTCIEGELAAFLLG